MKTKEELNALKEEVETLNKKLAELTDEELAQVFGGSTIGQIGTFTCPNSACKNHDRTWVTQLRECYLCGTTLVWVSGARHANK